MTSQINKYSSCMKRSRKSYVTHHTKRDLMGITKSTDRGQPAQSAHADHGRNFSLLADFLRIKR